MPFFCDVCDTAVTSYESWLVHVTTDVHQEGLGVLGGEVLEEILSPGVRERVIVAHDVYAEVPLLDVARFFSQFDILRNVVHRGSNEHDFTRVRVLIVFDTEAGVDSVMSFGPIFIGGLAVEVERLYVESHPDEYNNGLSEFAEDIPVESVASAAGFGAQGDDFGGGDFGVGGYGFGGSHYEESVCSGIGIPDGGMGVPGGYQSGSSNNYYNGGGEGNFYIEGEDFYGAADGVAESFNNNSGLSGLDSYSTYSNSNSFQELESPVRVTEIAGRRRRKKKKRKQFLREGIGINIKNNSVSVSGGSGNFVPLNHQQPLILTNSNSRQRDNSSRLTIDITVNGSNRSTVNVITGMAPVNNKSYVGAAASASLLSPSPSLTASSDIINGDGERERRKEAYLQLCRQIGDDMEGLSKVEDQVESFFQLFPLSESKQIERIGIAEELESLMSSRFSSCAIRIVGNDALGIATELDELIISVDPFGKLSEEFVLDEDEPVPPCQPHLIKEIYEILKLQQYQLKFCKDLVLKKTFWIFSSEDRIQKITFIHRGTGTKCILLLEQFILVQESRFLKFIATLDLRVQPLMCFVRCFSSVFGLLQQTPNNEPFPDHSMLWILVFFLISKNILPSVLHLQNLSFKELVVDNTDLSFCSSRNNIEFNLIPEIEDKSIRILSLVSILQEFFEFFGTADISRNVICPAIGKFVPVKAFGKELGEEFPKELHTRYLFNNDGSRRRYGFYAGSPMGLQDPFLLTTNLTKDVCYEGMCRFQDYFKRAAFKLRGILEGGCGLVTDIFTHLLDESAPLKRKRNEESDDEDRNNLYNKTKTEAGALSEQKVDSPWEMDTENEDESINDKNLTIMSFVEIRKSKIRMNQTLRKYFENAMSKILPQLLDDLYRDSIVADVLEEIVGCVEKLESEQTVEMETSMSILKDTDDVIAVTLDGNQNVETNQTEKMTECVIVDDCLKEKILVDNEYEKVVEDEDGHIFVIKKKNWNQMPKEDDNDTDDDSDEEAYQRDEDEKRRLLYGMTRKKFQILWVQCLKEFNTIFWTECFGFELETPPDADWTIPEYAKVNVKNTTEGEKKTLKQRWNEVPDCPDSVADLKNLHFRCVAPSEISDILYKKKVWKSKFLSAHLKSIWSIVSGKADAEPHEYDENIERVRLKTEVPFERRLEFSGRLEVSFDLREVIPPKTANLGTTATMKLTDEAYGLSGKELRAKKLRFLTTVYEKLAMKYVNVRVKQWLATCSDFDAVAYNGAFKKYRRNRQGHPKWRKFRKKWKALGMVG